MDHTLALIGRAHQGDKEARDTLFAENMGLVYSVTRRFLGRGVEMEDLFQIGSIGLLKAVDKFNPEFDVKFSTYAVPMIVGEIKRFLRDDGILKVSRSIKENQYKIYKVREEMEKKLGREPDMGELSKAMDMPVEELAMTMESAAEVDSIYKTVYQGDGTDLQLVDRLPEKEERRELRASYGFDDSDFVVGIMARIEVYKGHGDILEALHFLLEEGRKVKLIIAGTGSYEEELRRETERFPEGTVVFAGFISDISKILSVMDVQVNASYESETSSLSIIEGMSAGVPSVVSDCGGNPLLIEDGINGLVFPARDCGALAGCIRTLMDDSEKYHRMQKASCQIYEEKFTGGKFAANVEKVYEKMMKGDSHGK